MAVLGVIHGQLASWVQAQAAAAETAAEGVQAEEEEREQETRTEYDGPTSVGPAVRPQLDK